MGDLIHKLGIDWRLLVANIVTFLIVLAILQRFAFKPILRVLDKRRELAEKTVSQEKAAQAALAGADAQHKELVSAARREAGDILVEARAEAEALKERTINEAKDEAAKISTETRAELRREKAAMLSEAKQDLAELVVAAAGSLVDQKTGKQFDRKAADDVLKNISSHP